jgi:hypothetical protein
MYNQLRANITKHDWEIHRKPAAGGSWRLYDSTHNRSLAFVLARGYASSYPGDTFAVKQPGPRDFELEVCEHV